MQTSFRDRWLEPIVGAFLGGGLLLFGGVALFGLLSGGMRSTVPFVLELDDGVGLAQPNEVTISGVRVGAVQSVELAPDRRVRVALAVDHAYASMVRADAVGHATYTTTGKVVRILGGTEAAGPLAAGGTLQGTNFDPIATLERMDLVGNLQQVQTILERVTTLADELGLGQEELPQTAEAVRALIVDLREGRGTVGRLLQDDDLLERTLATMDEVRRTTAQVGQVSATMGEASKQVAAASGSITAASEEVGRTSDALRSSAQGITRSTDQLEASLRRMDATLVELDRTMRAIQQLPFVRNKVDDAPR
ncbi:MAG: MCE family protein [Myxococcales bacterium]|nr:MCE family protein [Myxococcales bacterium]